jgi:hypothetical protein
VCAPTAPPRLNGNLRPEPRLLVGNDRCDPAEVPPLTHAPESEGQAGERAPYGTSAWHQALTASGNAGLHRRCEDERMREEVRRAIEVTRNAPLEQRTIDITTTGRRSGQLRRIEIVFYRLEGAIYLSGIPAARRRDWLLNLEAEPGFVFHLKNGVVADLPAVATVITDPEERRRVLAHFVEEFNERNGPGRGWPRAVLDEWVADSPLARVDFVETS